jgi:hypothetical protein
MVINVRLACVRRPLGSCFGAAQKVRAGVIAKPGPIPAGYRSARARCVGHVVVIDGKQLAGVCYFRLRVCMFACWYDEEESYLDPDCLSF